ncbi:hypothetical protein [Glutamicibacter creatinolyticus]|uniref:hypothetical protein n=1 Tax=Glutamicibacter creatinolyticus TaxID=162496 RepID=UPI0031DECFE8
MARLADHVHRLLPSLPPAEWERPAPAPASLRRDVWAGLGFLVLALFMQELVQSLSEREDAVSRTIAYLVIAGLVAPLLVRRRWPILVMLSSSAVFMLAGVGDSAIVAMQLCAQLAYFLAIYTAVAWPATAARCGPRWPWCCWPWRCGSCSPSSPPTWSPPPAGPWSRTPPGRSTRWGHCRCTPS